MLALKKASDLSWGELKLIENPLTAKNIIESNHGKKVGGEVIHNANNFNLPSAASRSFDPYGEIHRNLENGAVFLVNSNTTNPVLKNIKISEQQRTLCDIAHGQNAMFVNAANAMLARVQVPSVSGVMREEPSQATNDKPAEQKKEREKHIILLNLEGQNDRPLPIKHNITLVVENTSQGNLPVRQLKEVIYDGFSRVFSSEKGDVFKVYAISDAMLDVKKDLNDNKNLSQSESTGLITALEETGTETRSDGVILHNIKYVVPNNYIEIELLDEDDVPEVGAKFQLLNKDNKIIHNGSLDDCGQAIVEGIDINDLIVFFPNVEESAIYDKAQGDQS